MTYLDTRSGGISEENILEFDSPLGPSYGSESLVGQAIDRRSFAFVDVGEDTFGG